MVSKIQNYKRYGSIRVRYQENIKKISCPLKCTINGIQETKYKKLHSPGYTPTQGLMNKNKNKKSNIPWKERKGSQRWNNINRNSLGAIVYCNWKRQLESQWKSNEKTFESIWKATEVRKKAFRSEFSSLTKSEL